MNAADSTLNRFSVAAVLCFCVAQWIIRLVDVGDEMADRAGLHGTKSRKCGWYSMSGEGDNAGDSKVLV